ncbi:hypothetical protein [Propioniciclava soli]|uniref:Polysaccharide chain length determinant N-terminal domain-containing protein n=1 Tax=Propioniciclava soli TaxID=2775081 RepID=A0ABZ3C5X6_9ACTN|nr:hypothetical protein [Propioniciclava soli]
MHLAYALSLVRRKLPWLLAGILIVALAALALLNSNRSYEATSHLVVRPLDTQVTERAVSPDRFLGNQAQVVLSDAVLTPAAVSLADGTDARELREHLTVTLGTQNDVLQVTAEGDDAEQAERRLAAVVTSVIERNDPMLLASVLWTGEPEVSASLVRNAVMAGVAALLGGIVLVILWGAVRRPLLDPRYAVLSSDDVEIYPRTVGVTPDGSLDEQDVTAWLRALAGDSGGRLMTADLSGTAVTAGFTERLSHRVAGRGDVTVLPEGGNVERSSRRPSLVVLVGEAGRTTEADVEERAAVLQALGGRTALVLVRGRRGGASRGLTQEVAA